MFIVQQVTDAYLQSQNITLPDSTLVSLQIKYVPLQFGWFIVNLTYGSFILQGMRITNNPNMLLQYQNLIPFGLACYTAGNREPTQQQDFLSGASTLYILDQSECKQYYEFLQLGPS